ncbi:MAG: folate-binding protein [Synechococcus sp. ELA057]
MDDTCRATLDDSQPPWNWTPAPGQVLQAPVSLLQLKGPDTLRFLHGQTSQAISGAAAGQWLSTCCISPTARMRALAEVLVSDDGAWLVIHSGDAMAVRGALDRVLFPADAVNLGELTPAWWLQPLPQPDVNPGAWRALEGGEGFWLGDQLVLFGDREPAAEPSAAELGDLEQAARDLLRCPRLGAVDRERLRIQRGEPAWPAELNEETNPFELGLAPRVSLSKGCYAGQETLARLATYDGVRQQLRRWSCQSDAIGEEATAAWLRPGARLESTEGERAGIITSSLLLPGSSIWIGLALVRRSCLEQECLVLSPAASADPAPALRLSLSKGEQFRDPPGSQAAG